MNRPKMEGDLVVGNTYDKYGTSNPIARLLLRNFLRNFEELTQLATPLRALEVGCGEGELSILLAEKGIRVLGTDISSLMVAEAKGRARSRGVQVDFRQADLFDLEPGSERFDLLVCCEVLEHLEDPPAAIRHLARLNPGHLLFSVPNEPTWRVLNMARGRYVRDLGNTPGHVQHWSRKSFLALLDRELDVVEERRPLPWLMALCRLRKGT
jgi:2-polyprenyl-3-methyl-5-hydroxy-6-metoxy-1,4-benzoquinol methylase